MDVKMGRYVKANVICWHKKDQGAMLGSKEWLHSKDRISLLRWEELVIKKKKLGRQWDHKSRIWRRYLGWNQECLSILYPTLRMNEKLSSKNWVLGTQYLDLGRLGEPTKYTQVQEQEVDSWEDRWELLKHQCAIEMVLWVRAQSSTSRNPSSRTECIPKALWLLNVHALGNTNTQCVG